MLLPDRIAGAEDGREDGGDERREEGLGVPGATEPTLLDFPNGSVKGQHLTSASGRPTAFEASQLGRKIGGPPPKQKNVFPLVAL